MAPLIHNSISLISLVLDMLGYESEKRLRELLDQVKEGELAIETRRERLCSILDFAPFSAFMRLDRNANDRISSFEILNFLRDNREYGITEGECYNLVKFFDSDADGKLTYPEYDSNLFILILQVPTTYSSL